MNDDNTHDDFDDSAFEQQLRATTLRAPSQRLDRRVLRTLSHYRSVGRMRSMWLGAAATLAIALGSAPLWRSAARKDPGARPLQPLALADQQSSSSSGGNSVKPVIDRSLSRPLVIGRTQTQVADEGIVAMARGMPVRRLRRQSLARLVVVDPRTGNRLAVTVPHDEVVVQFIRPF